MSTETRRCAIVTGVSEGGIGYYIVKQLANAPHNYTVTLACRNPNKARQAISALTRSPQPDGSTPVPADRLRFQQVDISSLASIKSFADQYSQSKLPLHLLVNNAASMGAQKSTVDGLEEAMALSHVASHYLILLLQDLLVASASSRVVNLNSAAHSMGTLGDDLSIPLYTARPGSMAGYADAKLYMMLDGRQWHEQLHVKGVSVIHANPGTVKTNFISNMNADGGKPWPKPLQWLLRWFIMPLFFVTADDGAAAIVSAATELTDEDVASSPYTVPKKGKDGRYHAHVAPSAPLGDEHKKGRVIFDLTNRIISEKTGHPR